MENEKVAPEWWIGSGSVVGDELGRVLPFNVQNLVGNWLMLIGQALITFNAQQQYLENGAGNWYQEDVEKKKAEKESRTAEEACQRDRELKELKTEIRRLENRIKELEERKRFC